MAPKKPAKKPKAAPATAAKPKFGSPAWQAKYAKPKPKPSK